MSTDTEIGRPANVPSEGPDHTTSRESGGRTARVLLVDDHSLFRQVLAILLERNVGFGKSLQAGSPAEARGFVGGHEGDELALAVVDLDMPNLDASELIGELRRRKVPVLALTVNGNQEQSVGSPEVGELLTTAATCEEILGTARRLIGR